jgi:hypothetical protein
MTIKRFNATVRSGVYAAKQWQRGSTAELDQWAKQAVTEKGDTILLGITREMNYDELLQVISAAVNAGY